MRDIKFRVWCEKHKTMVESENVKTISYGYGKGMYVNADALCAGKEILMQFIGLNDKNGIGMYEGDIVNCTYAKCSNKPNGSTVICIIIYDNETCSFKLKVKGSAIKVSFSDNFNEDVEIIGNIYEN